MSHEQVRELAQAVMAQRTEVEVFLVSSLQLVSARCCSHCALQPCRGSPGAALTHRPGARGQGTSWKG